MTDTVALKQVIEDSGMPKTHIAMRAGITRDRLYNILGGLDAKATEIESLSRVLKLTKARRDAIFFAKNVASETTE